LLVSWFEVSGGVWLYDLSRLASRDDFFVFVLSPISVCVCDKGRNCWYWFSVCVCDKLFRDLSLVSFPPSFSSPSSSESLSSKLFSNLDFLSACELPSFVLLSLSLVSLFLSSFFCRSLTNRFRASCLSDTLLLFDSTCECSLFRVRSCSSSESSSSEDRWACLEWCKNASTWPSSNSSRPLKIVTRISKSLLPF
jgi:hypothetical protein